MDIWPASCKELLKMIEMIIIDRLTQKPSDLDIVSNYPILIIIIYMNDLLAIF